MIEEALYEHLTTWASLVPYLTEYSGKPAVFNQEAPADADPLWESGPQYCRIVFAVDIQGDPERTMGGTLAVDVQCRDGDTPPEVLEPIVREAIHGWFFSKDLFTVEAQWRGSAYFTEPTDRVRGVTVSFDLLAFPVMTTGDPDIITRINAWTAAIDGLHVINHDPLPSTAWRPEGTDSAIYWRVVTDQPANWIPDTFQTIWRIANLRGHIFSADYKTMAAVARDLIVRLYTDKRILKQGESPIMINRSNRADYGMDPLRTGQLSVEATYGVIVYYGPDTEINNITIEEEGSPINHV